MQWYRWYECTKNTLRMHSIREGTVLSPAFWGGGDQKKMNPYGDLKSSSNTYLSGGGLLWYLSKRRKIEYMLYGFQMLILALVLHISSTSNFNLVQALVQDLLIQSLLKLTTSLGDVRRCYVWSIAWPTPKISNFESMNGFGKVFDLI